MMGYRAITPPDVVCVEAVPKRGYHAWRIRRAQHLVQHFAKAIRDGKAPPPFKPILHAEAYLHLANPWALPTAAAALAAAAAAGSLPAAALLATGAALALYKPYRTWTTMMLGTPPVAFARGAIPELVEGTEAEAYLAHNLAEFAKAAKKALEEPPPPKLAKEAREKFRTELDRFLKALMG